MTTLSCNTPDKDLLYCVQSKSPCFPAACGANRETTPALQTDKIFTLILFKLKLASILLATIATNFLLQIKDYIYGSGPDVPLLLLGGPGTGKSSIMAKAVDTTITAAIDRRIPG